MAVYTVSNTGGNYNVGTTWVGGVVPLTTDTIDFTATSGNLTINVASTCAGIDFTNYLGTLTVNTLFRINGNINLGTGGYTVAGPNTTYIGATGTITSNGVVWAGNFGFLGTSQTYTLADDLTVNGTITYNVTTLGTLNGFNLYAKGTLNITNGSLIGTTDLYLIGTGTLNVVGGNMILGLNTTINTTGTITFGANGVKFGNGKTFTYISGTVNATNVFYVNSTCSLNVAPIAFNAFQINGISTVCTLLDNITVNGELRFNGSTACTVNGFNIYCNSNVYIQPNYTINGTTVLQLVGASMTWTHQTVSYMGLPIFINTSGTLTFGVNGLRLSGGTSLIYTAGTLAGSYYLYFGGSRILDLNTSVWLQFTNAIATTITLLSDLNISGNFSNGSGTLTINGLYKVYIGGNLTRSSNTVFSGTASLEMNGTGIWSDLYQAQIFGFDLTINTTGTITISGTVRINEAFTYVAGTVITTGSTLVLPSNGVSYDLNGIVFNIVQFNGGQTRTFLSDMTCRTLNVTGAASTTNGSSIYFNNLQYQTTNGSIGLGTTTFVFAGTGTWSHSTTGRFSNNLVIDTGVSGVTTFTTSNYITNGTVTHISGTVNQGVYTVTLAGSATMDTSGMTWGTILVNGGVTTLLSTLKADRIQNNGFTTMTFAGAFGFEVDKFALTTPFNITVTLVNGVRYLIKQSILSNTPGYTRLFTCVSGAALLDLQYGATQNLANTSATRINSLGGQTIYTTGTLTSTQNWNTGTYRNPTNFMIMF